MDKLSSRGFGVGFGIGIEKLICGQLISYDANFEFGNWHRELKSWLVDHLVELIDFEIGIEKWKVEQVIIS